MAEETDNSFNWHSAIDETLHDLARHFLDYFPQLLGALLLLLIGYGAAHLAKAFSKKAIHGLDDLFCKLSPKKKAKGVHITPAYTRVTSRVVFWCVLLFFIAASANLLGWKMFAGWMDGIILHLPNILTGFVIILVGFVVSNIVLSFIQNSNLSTNSIQKALLARIAQVVIIVSAVLIGVEHIGLDMHFLTDMATIIVAVLLSGACLAFGLGARDMVANTIGSQYARRNCQLGERINLAGYEGELVEIRQTCIVLEDAKEGRVLIPSKLFNETISVIRMAPQELADVGSGEASSGKDAG